MELSELQQEIVKTDARQVVVASCAGSGKTACLVGRCQHLLNNGVDPKKIVLITFTNAAAEEISDRLERPQGLFIGTIHSYANYLLLSNGQETREIIESGNFDELFEKVKNRHLNIKEVEHLLLDEGQDSTDTQFEFIFDIVKPSNWMIFCDWRQSIYRWNGANPDFLIDLSTRFDVTTYELDENYRNAPEILDFARGLICPAGYIYQDRSYAMRNTKGRLSVGIEYNPQSIARTFSEMDESEYGKWFVLTRTNAQLEEIELALKRKKIPYDTFKRSELDNTQLKERMSRNTVKILTIHTAKGLEADNVLVVGARSYNIEEKCISYVAATRARDRLVWTKAINKRRPESGTANWEV